jgi:para-aminobenzoate synthetase/4-amino-4-deoxychorismate lyase
MRAMFTMDAPFVLVEDRVSPEGGGRLFARPVEIVACDSVGEVSATIQRIIAAQREGLHAAGYFAYELGYAFEARLAEFCRRPSSGPLAWFGLFDRPVELARRELDAMFGALPPPSPLRDVEFVHTRDEHIAKAAAIQTLIQAGDLYQANLTFPIRFRYDGAAASLYAALRVGQPVGHGALIWTGRHWAISVSPELFFSVRDGVMTARPMKGTSARGADPASDNQARTTLAADPKQRAENLMIVDLLRNDLSRVAAPGSVSTPALFTVETYPTFHAMTSTVTGAMRPDVGLEDLLKALFPCGSVVGAPKIMASQVIARLEAEPRGVYCGAIGSIAPTGEMAFSVAIRTAVLQTDGTGHYGVGGGVVADSVPADEYDEALLKARVVVDLAAPLELIETFRWEPGGGFQRLQRHLDRLSRSAEALGYRFDCDALVRSLEERSSAWPSEVPLRVRATLQPSGLFGLSATPLESAAEQPVRVMISDEVLDSADPFLRHKTSRRGRHEHAFRSAAAAGYGEALLLNEEGQVADGSRSTVFVERDGRLVTPPISCGALPGVLRAELIERGRASEGELARSDLENATIFLGSSLRGLRPALLG